MAGQLRVVQRGASLPEIRAPRLAAHPVEGDLAAGRALEWRQDAEDDLPPALRPELQWRLSGSGARHARRWLPHLGQGPSAPHAPLPRVDPPSATDLRGYLQSGAGRGADQVQQPAASGCDGWVDIVFGSPIFYGSKWFHDLNYYFLSGCSQVSSISPNPHMEPPRRLLLQYLDLTDCMAIDDMGLKIVVKNCPQLVYLYLRRCIQVTGELAWIWTRMIRYHMNNFSYPKLIDAGLKFVPSFCVSLKELSVSDCLNITDFGLYELAKLGAALRYLSVAKCERVSDAGLKVIARRCYKLRYLNARGCEAVSDDSITVLARSCPRLRALDIGKCDVSDAGLRALAESCPNLKKLSLRSCDMITDRGVQCIAYYCRGLQQLNIQDCPVSIEGYRAVKKYCKRCIIEHTNPGFCWDVP